MALTAAVYQYARNIGQRAGRALPTPPGARADLARLDRFRLRCSPVFGTARGPSSLICPPMRSSRVHGSRARQSLATLGAGLCHAFAGAQVA